MNWIHQIIKIGSALPKVYARIGAALLAVVILTASPCFAGGKGTSFGTNVGGTLYYNEDAMYVDLLRHSTGWFGPAVKVNSDGMLSSGYGQCAIETGGYQTGDYLFYGEGKFTISFSGSAYGSWPNNGTVPGTQHTVNDVTTAVVHIDVPPPGVPTWSSTPQNEILINLTVTDTTDPPRNFHLICPGYKAWPNTEATFTKEFLQAVNPFSCYRMIDWMGTIGSTVSTWASRPQPNGFGCSNTGAAYERFIELANTTNRDLWINIPTHATDDWAAGMAHLLKTTLKPGLHAYFELSDECWNWGAPFWPTWNQIEVWDQTNTALTSTAAWTRHGQEVAFLLMHYIQIMQPIMSAQARFVLAGQYGNPVYITGGLEWIQQVYGPPSNYLYATAGAPYFSGSGTDLDSLFSSINANVATIAQTLPQEVALARQYGLKYCLYECGQSLGPDPSNFDLYLSAQQDPRMGAAYTTYAAIINSAGVDLANFYNFIDGWGQYGFWGASNDIRTITNNTCVKYAAEAAIAKAGSQNEGALSIRTDTKQGKAAAAAAEKAARARAKWLEEKAKAEAHWKKELQEEAAKKKP